MNQSINQSTNQSINKSINQSINQSMSKPAIKLMKLAVYASISAEVVMDGWIRAVH